MVFMKRLFGNPDPEPEPEAEPVETRTLGEIAYQPEQDLPAVQRRLRQGAKPNDPAEFGSQYGMYAPLSCAAQKGHVQVVDALADAGADLSWTHPLTGQTAQHAAAGSGQARVVRSLAGVSRRWTRAGTTIRRRCTGLS